MLDALPVNTWAISSYRGVPPPRDAPRGLSLHSIRRKYPSHRKWFRRCSAGSDCGVSRFAPFGYRLKEGQLVPNGREQRAAEKARTLRESGLTYRAVVDALNRERVPCRGRRWHLSTVHAILNAA